MARAARVVAPLALAAALAASPSPAGAQGVPGWLQFVGGAVSSILVHEAGHVTASALLGGSPSFGFDRGRPVIYSGLNSGAHPDRQFVFSAAGMSVQLLLNEVLLAWPHEAGERARPFERGVLAGGVGTVLFYFTIGRTASVSDVTQMARYSGLDRWTLAAIFGGVAASEVVRIAVRDRYGPHFFVLPGPQRTIRLGATLSW